MLNTRFNHIIFFSYPPTLHLPSSFLTACHPPQIYLVSGFTDLYSYSLAQLRNDMNVSGEVCSPAMTQNW